MLEFVLRSAQFFVNRVDHRFFFDVLKDGEHLMTIPVVTANIDGGPNAIHERAHDKLVEFLQIALDEAKTFHRRRYPQSPHLALLESRSQKPD